MMTYHSVKTSSLPIKFFKIDKFCDFSSDIDYIIKTNIFRDVITLKINHCLPVHPNASGGHSVRQPRSANKRIYIYKH